MNYEITLLVWGGGTQPTEAYYGQIGNPDPGQIVESVFSFTLVQGGGRNILVDCGMNVEGTFKKEHFASVGVTTHGPVEALALIDMKPEDIDTVILTHAHLDHMGALELFPNARFFIQRDEFETWEKMANDPKYLALSLTSVLACDFETGRKLIDEGRMVLLGGEVVNFLPGISIKVFRECHSVAEQVVMVDTAKGVYAICGDLGFTTTNMTGAGEWSAYLPPIFARSGSARRVFAAYTEVLSDVEGDTSRIILSHDDALIRLPQANVIDKTLASVKLV